MKKHFYWIDCFRALAMLEVLLSHYRNVLLPAWNDVDGGVVAWVLYFATRWGHLSVIVFFVLSGFLVGGDAIERAIEGNFDEKNFIKKRIMRIFPTLAVLSLLTILAFPMVHIAVPWARIVCNILCLQGIVGLPLFGPWWALSIEVWFYVICCSTIMILGRYKWIGLFVTIAMLAVFIKGPWHFLLIWIIGALAYFRLPKAKSVMRIIMSAGIFFASLYLSRRFHFGPKVEDMMSGLAFSFVIRESILWQPQNQIWGLVERIGSKIASISYSVYLSHMLLMVVLMNTVFTVSSDATVDQEYIVDGTRIFGKFSGVGFPAVLALSGCAILSLMLGWSVSIMSERWNWDRILRRKGT